MIQVFVDRFIANRPNIRQQLSTAYPMDYDALVELVIKHITADEYKDYAIDPERISSIDYGNYQGTRLYIIAEKGYQPSKFYYVSVEYGSCSVCDTLGSIIEGIDKTPSKVQLDDLMSMCLHVVQQIKLLDGESI